MPEDRVRITLKRGSWENIIDCLRKQDAPMKTRGNFWDAVQEIERQLAVVAKPMTEAEFKKLGKLYEEDLLNYNEDIPLLFDEIRRLRRLEHGNTYTVTEKKLPETKNGDEQHVKPYTPGARQLFGRPFVSVQNLSSFENGRLVRKFGSWVRVQVAFYDFLFLKGSGICAGCFKDEAIKELATGFRDGENIYERTVKAIEKLYPTPQAAWDAFAKEVEL